MPSLLARLGGKRNRLSVPVFTPNQEDDTPGYLLCGLSWLAKRLVWDEQVEIVTKITTTYPNGSTVERSHSGQARAWTDENYRNVPHNNHSYRMCDWVYRGTDVRWYGTVLEEYLWRWLYRDGAVFFFKGLRIKGAKDVVPLTDLDWQEDEMNTLMKNFLANPAKTLDEVRRFV